MRSSRSVLLFLAAAGIVQILHYYPSMPERMASHFDGSGRPDGFQSRDAFFAISAAMMATTAVMFGGLGALFRRIPSKWFNLPNRDHWLAPERREETIEYMSSQLEWLGAATLALYVFVIQMVAETNRTSEPRLDSGSMFLVLGLFFTYTTIWIVRFLLRFRKPKPEVS